MAKFRQNHKASSSRITSIVRILFIIFLLVSLLIGLSRNVMPEVSQKESGNRENIYKSEMLEGGDFFIPPGERMFLPALSSGQLIHHNYYSLEYMEEWEQARWVCYSLTRESIRRPNVPRFDWFMADDKVSSSSAEYADYYDRDYTRGHLAPAGDMAFNALAMKESFVMSNISPQRSNFNDGIWNELEQSVRDWAFKRGELLVCSGPVFYDDQIKRIGKNKVAVPHGFFKCVLDPDKKQAIAFVISNAVSDLPLGEFALSIDELENISGIDFFPDLESKDTEIIKAESTFELENWPFSEKRYKTRVEQWNKD